MSKKKQKFYTVWKGRKPGVYDNWEDCKAQTDGFEGARFRSFATKELAEKAFNTDYHEFLNFGNETASENNIKDYETNAIAVDASCTGNPGMTEFQGIDLRTGKKIMESKNYTKGTNNIGEFLAIVKCLEMIRIGKIKGNPIIYSDSQAAIAAVKNKKMKTSLTEDTDTREILQDLAKGTKMLNTYDYKTEIRKWDTQKWGEIPADFGRKK